MRNQMKQFAIAVILLFVTGCGTGTESWETREADDVGVDSSETEGIWQPSPGTSWQWQLRDPLITSYDVDMYDIDLFDTSAAAIAMLKSEGRVVICYFSAGSYEDWRPDAGDFPPALIGEPLDGWEGEYWLDVRALDTLQPILEARLDLAEEKECDGVEPDNVDGYTNDTGFPLSGDDQLKFNRRLAEAAHDRGLSIGLKNDLNQIPELVDHFDWALNEQCFEFDECDTLLPFIEAGKAVFGVEYNLDSADFCPQANEMDLDWLKMDLLLDGGREACR